MPTAGSRDDLTETITDKVDATKTFTTTYDTGKPNATDATPLDLAAILGGQGHRCCRADT